MANKIFEYEYHDSNLEKVEIGPRRELNLKIHLDPIWNKGRDRNIKLSFRGIDNLETVKQFFKDYLTVRPKTTSFLDTIDGITKEGKNEYVIELDRIGRLTIKCKEHVETIDASA